MAIGRFISLDPLAEKFPSLTTYQYASNDPVRNIDLDGLEGTLPQPAPLPYGNHHKKEKTNFAIQTTVVPFIRANNEPAITVVRTEMIQVQDHNRTFYTKVTELQFRQSSYKNNERGGLIVTQQKTNIVLVTSNMDCCTDGIGKKWGDSHHSNETAYTKPDGSFYNADIDRYIVLPTNIIREFGLKGNSVVYTEYQGKIVKAVLGENNEDQKIGEGARILLIDYNFNPDPETGGHKESDVNYFIQKSGNMDEQEIRKMIQQYLQILGAMQEFKQQKKETPHKR